MNKVTHAYKRCTQISPYTEPGFLKRDGRDVLIILTVIPGVYEGCRTFIYNRLAGVPIRENTVEAVKFYVRGKADQDD